MNFSDVKPGDILVADGGFTCIDEGAELTVCRGHEDALYVACDDGRHYLDGQVSGKILIGFEPKAGPQWHEIKCPNCGRDDQLDVDAVVSIRLTPSGSDADMSEDGSHIWDDNSMCSCIACGGRGKVRDFK